MKNKNILIHDTSGIYTDLVRTSAIENENIFFTSSIYNFHNIDFSKFSLIILFINTLEDLIDFAYINNIPDVTIYAGASNRNIYNKLQCFSKINLFEINAPKKYIISNITSLIKFETENHEEISKHELI
jgi:hypothetical protein